MGNKCLAQIPTHLPIVPFSQLEVRPEKANKKQNAGDIKRKNNTK